MGKQAGPPPHDTIVTQAYPGADARSMDAPKSDGPDAIPDEGTPVLLEARKRPREIEGSGAAPPAHPRRPGAPLRVAALLGNKAVVYGLIGFVVGCGAGVLTTLFFIAPGALAQAESQQSAPAAAEAQAMSTATPPASMAGAGAAATAPTHDVGASKPKPSARATRPSAQSAATPSAPAAAAAAATTGSTLTVQAVGRSAAQGAVPARVFLDGIAIGKTPLNAYAVQPGNHRLRVDCIYEGKTYPGTESALEIPPNTDAAIEHTCDVWVLLGGPGKE